jgi:hypothetical protein
VVYEGEYRMMNTFDLTVDHLFLELAWHPWTVRNTLDLFADRYAYTDSLHTGGGSSAPGGGRNAMCDQIRSDTGVACGSRYYPRGVTTILWMRE